MKKNIILSATLSLLAMVALPLAIVFFIGGIDAAGILLLSLVIVNPIVSAIIGVLSFDKKIIWYLPVINATVFLIAESIITGFDIIYIVAAIAYVGIGIAAAFIKKSVKFKKAQ